MAPHRALVDPTRATEVRLAPGRGTGDPAATADEIAPAAARRRWARLAGDVRVRRRDDDIGDPVDDDVERVDGDVARARTCLLIDDHPTVRQRQGLVRRPGDGNRLAVPRQPAEVRAAAGRRARAGAL